jgi:hypothetical protein
MNWMIIEKIAEQVFSSMNGDAHQINNGDCAVFAKKMSDMLTEKGIEHTIKVTESFELENELEGYEYEVSEYAWRLSHCYVMVGDYGFDAYDLRGEDESEMTYINKL